LRVLRKRSEKAGGLEKMRAVINPAPPSLHLPQQAFVMGSAVGTQKEDHDADFARFETELSTELLNKQEDEADDGGSSSLLGSFLSDVGEGARRAFGFLDDDTGCCDTTERGHIRKPGVKFKNWSNNILTDTPVRFPKTEVEIVNILNEARVAGLKLKVVGSGHSSAPRFENSTITISTTARHTLSHTRHFLIINCTYMLTPFDTSLRSPCCSVINSGEEGIVLIDLGNFSSTSVADCSIDEVGMQVSVNAGMHIILSTLYCLLPLQ
jgi:hypothetical protein